MLPLPLTERLLTTLRPVFVPFGVILGLASGIGLPEKASRSGKADDWSDVPDDQGYGPMRDAIVRQYRKSSAARHLMPNFDVRNAWIAENIGPVLIVSEGALTISQGSRFTDNKGQLLATGPITNVQIQDTQFLRNGHSSFGGTAAAGGSASSAPAMGTSNKVCFSSSQSR
jgi:hypothetical protein